MRVVEERLHRRRDLLLKRWHTGLTEDERQRLHGLRHQLVARHAVFLRVVLEQAIRAALVLVAHDEVAEAKLRYETEDLHLSGLCLVRIARAHLVRNFLQGLEESGRVSTEGHAKVERAHVLDRQRVGWHAQVARGRVPLTLRDVVRIDGAVARTLDPLYHVGIIELRHVDAEAVHGRIEQSRLAVHLRHGLRVFERGEAVAVDVDRHVLKEQTIVEQARTSECQLGRLAVTGDHQPFNTPTVDRIGDFVGAVTEVGEGLPDILATNPCHLVAAAVELLHILEQNIAGDCRLHVLAAFDLLHLGQTERHAGHYNV